MRDENQLHAAVVELVALDNAEIKYSTVQNWYPGDKQGKGGIYNFVTKRGCAKARTRRSPGRRSRPVRPSPGNIRAASCSATVRGEFYSVALTNNFQQADTGTKMIHIGKNTSSTIISKGISAGRGQNSYRGLVEIRRARRRAELLAVRLAADRRQVRGAHVPLHRSEEQHRPRRARGHDLEDRRGPDLLLQRARHRDAGRREHDRERLLQGSLPELPMEFAVEAQKLLGVSLEGSVG
jgi:Fe-S cluster assembly protein SufB